LGRPLAVGWHRLLLRHALPPLPQVPARRRRQRGEGAEPRAALRKRGDRAGRSAPVRRFVLGEFTRPEACVEAARKLREGGVAGLDAYSPYPLHGIDEALALPR